MTSITEPFYVSRSEIQDYKACGALRWNGSYAQGTGLERKALNLPRLNGNTIHAALAALIGGEQLELVVSREVEKYRQLAHGRGLAVEFYDGGQEWLIEEQCCLLEGIIRGWAHFRLPKILEAYEVVEIETQHNLEMIPNLIMPVRFDALLRRKSTGFLEVKEFKTVGYFSDDWLEQWHHKSQLMQQTWAVQKLYASEPFAGVSIEGIVKGRLKKETRKSSGFNGRMIQDSLFCYAWTNGVEIEPGWQSAKWDHVAVWQKVRDGAIPSMRAWVEWNLQAVEKLFSPVPALKPHPWEIKRWIRQTVRQEKRIYRGLEAYRRLKRKQAVLDTYFPMNDDHCQRYYGHPCEFMPLCFDRDVRRDPIGSGLFVPREKHYTVGGASE